MKVQHIMVLAMLVLMLALLPSAFAKDANEVEQEDYNQTTIGEDTNNSIVEDTNQPHIEDSTPDQNNIDHETSDEIKTMTTGIGKQVRLLQLEKSLARNVLVGATVLEVLQKNHPDANLLPAQTTLDSLEVLITEVQTMPPTGDANTLAQNFVAIKKEGISLTQEFRKQTAPFVTEADREEIKTAVHDLDKNELHGYNEQIKGLVNKNNADKVAALLQLMNASNPALVAKIADGNATKEEVASALKSAYDALTPTEQATVNTLLKENVIKRIVNEKQVMGTMRQELGNKMREREAQQLQKLSEWQHNQATKASERGYDERAQRLEARSQKLENMSVRMHDGNKPVPGMMPPKGKGNQQGKPPHPPEGPQQNAGDANDN